MAGATLVVTPAPLMARVTPRAPRPLQPVRAVKPMIGPARGRCQPALRVVAAASGGGTPPTPADPSPVPAGSPLPVPTVFLRDPSTRTYATSGGGGATGGPGGIGGAGGGIGGRPVGLGGRGDGGSGGGLPRRLPPGWNLNRILLVALGVALAIPAWRYLNRRYLLKPEPEHTIAKVEDAAAEAKRRGAVSKAASAVKHATVDPVRDTLAAGVHAIKHGDVARTVQHKAEEVKDTADVAAYDASAKAERAAAKAKKEVKHAYEDTKAKGEDVASAADVKAHEAGVKGGRAVQHAKEAVVDTLHDAEKAAGKATKGVLEGIKGAATTVGRKLHVVADATEKGTKKAVGKAERATGVKKVTGPVTSTSERRRAYYIASGVALGVGTLGALYWWDQKGGDISGKVRKLQGKTKEAADTAMGKAREALGRPAPEPAGPTRPAA